MRSKSRNTLIIFLITIANFVANFLIFTYSYNRLVTPYLAEEQRVSNADFIMTGTLGMYAAVAIVTGILIYLFLKSADQSRPNE
jgi:hypothetical protein